MGVEHQIATIGAVQCPRGQQVEVGDEGAEARHVLDPADQGLVGRVILVDHRRAVLPAIVDDDVDLIAAETRLGHGFLGRGRDRTWAGTPRGGCAGARKSSAFSLMSRSTASRCCTTSGKSQ